MATAVWTGTISFGLVTIGVKLYPATQPKDVRFRMLDREGRRVRYRRFVEADVPRHPYPAAVDVGAGDVEVVPDAPPASPEPTEVAFSDLIRGYETGDGTVVAVTPEEIASVRPTRSRTIDIEDFVELDEIDPIFFDKAYFVIPTGEDAVGAYGLLHAAMRAAERVGIGRFVLRTKPHLVAVRATEDALALHTLFFGDEVRDVRALLTSVPTREVDERQLDLAVALIEALKTGWDPTRYADTYREELLALLASKQPLREADEPYENFRPASNAVESLMAALRESVERARSADADPDRRHSRGA